MSSYKMAYISPEAMVFGHSVNPVSYGFGIEAGAGSVIPEANYTPRSGAEKSPERLRHEYVDLITKDVLDMCVENGFPNIQLETEWISLMGIDSKFAIPTIVGQKEIANKYHNEYGINVAVRHTIPDLREFERGLRVGTDTERRYPERIIENTEVACENGADIISLESLGGKEVTDYAVTNGDISAFLFGSGILGAFDMKYIWENIVPICKKHGTVPGGDTNCSASNTAMFLAGGMMDMDVQKTFSAICRCISASNTLVAFECGATGPGKDCAYEGVIVKAINGAPISQEGKMCHCAHFDLQGNLMAQCADVWSNESVEYHSELGGSSVQCWTSMLGHECSLMNASIENGTSKTLRDLYMISDRFRSPESYLLAYDNAWRIAKSIAQYGDELYLRGRAAALEGIKILYEGYGRRELDLTKMQLYSLEKMRNELMSLPDGEDEFIEKSMERCKREIPGFNPGNYLP